MNIQTLTQRISQCVDDLGRLLDQIYKFPQKQRQSYFQRIQSMKNKLLTLKGNARESNSSLTEKQYKQLYISTNSLKNQIQQQLVLYTSVKQNKDANRFKDIKQVKRNYDESMKLLVLKDEEISEVKRLLFEKQQLLRITRQELLSVKESYDILLEENQAKKCISQSNYEIQFHRMKSYLSQVESDLMQMKIREQEKDKTFDRAIQELQRLKLELIAANQRIVDLNHQLQLHKAKNKTFEQTAKKTDKKAETMADSYQDSFRKLRQVSELEYELGVRNDSIRELEQHNKHLKEDIEVLENEVTKLQNKDNEVKVQTARQRESLAFEQKRREQELQSFQIREKQLRRLLEEADKKYILVVNQLNTAQEVKIKLKESDFQNQLLEQKIYGLEGYIEKLQADIKILSKQKQKILIQQQRYEDSARDLELQIFKLNEKIRIKDEDITGLYHELEEYKSKAREYERELSIRSKKQKVIQSNLIEEKTRLIKLQQKEKARNKEIESLKVKLLRAKMETIHQIRQAIK